MSSPHGSIPTGICLTILLATLTTIQRGVLPTAAVPVNQVNDICGNVELTPAFEPKFITSPGYPRNYHNTLWCKWTVVSEFPYGGSDIVIDVLDLLLESCCDFVTIYDGDSESDPTLSRLTGSEVPGNAIKPTGHAVVIIFTTDGSATLRGFKMSYRLTADPMFPFISESIATTVTQHTAEWSVDVLSRSKLTLHWSRGSVMIQQDTKHNITLTPVNDRSGSPPDNSTDNVRVTLKIINPELQDFGLYRLVAKNKYGVMERSINISSAKSVPMLLNCTASPEEASIVVKFSTDPIFKVEWHKNREIIFSGIDVDITTAIDDSDTNGVEATSMLRLISPTVPGFGEYTCFIRNSMGVAEIFIDLEFPVTELPKVLTSAVQVNDQQITLSVNFDSNIPHSMATWYHEKVPLRSSEKYVTEINQLNHQDIFSSSYKYPSIGSDRSSTQTNAEYVAVLNVSSPTVEDFGRYEVVIENQAGKTHYVIDVTPPEVFFHYVCNQTDSISLICNVKSCSVSQSWIHSIDGKVVRNLKGHQNGTINTLTIPTCMYSDAGTYTCIATDTDTGSGVTFIHNRTTLTVRAAPVLLPSSVSVQDDRIEIGVPFYSNPPHRYVIWHRNGETIYSRGVDVISLESRDVNLTINGKEHQHAGRVAKVAVREPTAEMFGTYKVAITNEMGTSELIIDVPNPDYVDPVISYDVSVSYGGRSARLNMTFTSHYNYISVVWNFRDKEIRGDNTSKYEIHTDQPGNVPDQRPLLRSIKETSSVLTVMHLSDEDYGKYDVIVSNEAGRAVIPVFLYKEDRDIPIVVGKMNTTEEIGRAHISVHFYSSPNHTRIRWFMENDEIPVHSAKYSFVSNDIDIDISSNSGTVRKTGTIARLSVTSLEDKDFGLYTVQIYNDVGVTEGSVTLEEGCS